MNGGGKMHGMILVEIHVVVVLGKGSEVLLRTTGSFHGDWKEDCHAPMLSAVVPEVLLLDWVHVWFLIDILRLCVVLLELCQ